MLLIIENDNRHSFQYNLMYTLDDWEKFAVWKALRNKVLGYQEKEFYTNGGGKYRSKMFADHLRLAYILT